MASTSATSDRFPLIGNRLCIDFANSIWASKVRPDGLTDWASLLDFLEVTGVVTLDRKAKLQELAPSKRTGTPTALAARELRDALRKILEAIVGRQAIRSEWIQPINSLLRLTEGYDQVQPEGGNQPGAGWRLGFAARHERLEWLLAAIARSAAELIAEGPGAPVRKCGNPRCVLYFYDSSPTRRRRWCSMAVCGNRNKVATHARRNPKGAPREHGGMP